MTKQKENREKQLEEEQTPILDNPFALAIGYSGRGEIPSYGAPGIIGFYRTPEEVINAAYATVRQRDVLYDGEYPETHIRRAVCVLPFALERKEWEKYRLGYGLECDLKKGNRIYPEKRCEHAHEFRSGVEGNIEYAITHTGSEERPKAIARVLSSMCVYYDLEPLCEELLTKERDYVVREAIDNFGEN